MIGLLFGGAQFTTMFGNDYGNVELDANLEESHQWQAQATDNPVETGAPVADHVIEQSDKLRIRGFVSDTPLTISPELSGTIGTTDAGSRTQPVFELLYKLIKAREPVTVYTKHAVYSDMVLTNVEIPRTSQTGEAIEFSAEFVAIRFVQTQTVDVPKGISAKSASKSGATSKKAEPKKDTGKTDPVVKAPTSIASVGGKAALDFAKQTFSDLMK